MPLLKDEDGPSTEEKAGDNRKDRPPVSGLAMSSRMNSRVSYASYER